MSRSVEVCGHNLKPCCCGGHPLESDPIYLDFRIFCSDCGRETKVHKTLEKAVRYWNRIANKKTSWYCLACHGRYMPFPYASNEYLTEHLTHESKVACMIHCWWLNMKGKREWQNTRR